VTREEISRADAIRIIARARESFAEPSELKDLVEDWHAQTVFDALLDAYAGETNGFLGCVCEAITGTPFRVVGKPEERLSCPCCHRRTLTERHDRSLGTGYDICDYCRWEDDGTTRDDARSSVNRGSMAEYRARIGADPDVYCCEKWPK
jgi:hypothetical protein